MDLYDALQEGRKDQSVMVIKEVMRVGLAKQGEQR
jgi:hypothetical protein